MTGFEPILFAVSVTGTLAVIVTFVLRGHEIGWELSGESAFALYVRMASLAGSVVFTMGLAELLRAWLVTMPLPEGYTALTSRLSLEQVVRGGTLVTCGGGFWVVHFLLPRPHVRDRDLLYLAFLTVGAAAFGLAALVTLPLGLSQEIQRLFGLNAPPRTDGTLGGGLAALLIWLGHLWQLRSRFGRSGPYRAELVPVRGADPGPPPAEPSGSGAPRVHPPDTRSASAAALPPDHTDRHP